MPGHATYGEDLSLDTKLTLTHIHKSALLQPATDPDTVTLPNSKSLVEHFISVSVIQLAATYGLHHGETARRKFRNWFNSSPYPTPSGL